jgi:glycosyltransferase involved in cell wall biosynthesis
VLYFGGFHPRKNVEFLARAFLAAELGNYQLVLAGALTPAFKEFLSSLPAEQKSKIVTPGYADLNDQPGLYHHAVLFVSASLSEGFGYPLAEAMASQTLALASDLPVFREVGGQAVSYFNPKELSELTTLIKKMVQLPPAERRAILKAQSHQATQFSAEVMGKQTLALYNRVINEGSGK